MRGKWAVFFVTLKTADKELFIVMAVAHLSDMFYCFAVFWSRNGAVAVKTCWLYRRFRHFILRFLPRLLQFYCIWIAFLFFNTLFIVSLSLSNSFSRAPRHILRFTSDYRANSHFFPPLLCSSLISCKERL